MKQILLTEETWVEILKTVTIKLSRQQKIFHKLKPNLGKSLLMYFVYFWRQISSLYWGSYAIISLKG